MVNVPCCQCGRKFADISSLNVHFHCSHKNCTTFVCNIACENDRLCSRRYNVYNSYRKHLILTHHIPIFAPELRAQVLSERTPDDDNTTRLAVFLDQQERDAQDDNVADECNVNVNVNVNRITSADAKDLLLDQEDVIVAKFYANPAFPRNLVTKVVNEFSNYVTSPFFEHMEKLVMSSLDSNMVEARSEIEDMFDRLRHPFDPLQTEYKRLQYFESCGHYIPPVLYPIDYREERVKSKKGVTLEMRPVPGQKIPLQPLLKNFFELPDAFEDTLANMLALQEERDWICNMVQGEIWKRKRARFSDDAIVFPINFYYDEVEPNSALGPHCEPLGCSYVHIPVLPSEWNSRLENIFLAALFDGDNRTVYGNKKTFQPVIRELVLLETEGVKLNLPERGEVTMFLAVGLILGDNKALNSICGFQEGFSAIHYCRVCTCPNNLAKKMFVEDPALLRTPVSYANDVRIDQPKVTGVKEECVFNEIPSFECPTDISLDYFHDFIEGIAHYTMVPVSKHFHQLNNMFISTLNTRLYALDLGIDGDNRPPLINLDRLLSKDKLKMTGSEMTLFIRIFGLIVYDMVPEGDPFYDLYLLLNDITSILNAKGLPKDASVILSHKMEEHHKLYVELTKEDLKPKHHLGTHYPRKLKLMGPYYLFSTIREEAKHREARMVANACMSRVNLSRTVAIKHQLNFAYRCVSKSSIRQLMTHGPCHFINLVDLETFPSFSLTLPDHIFKEPMQTVTTWATYKGTTYAPKQILVFDVDDIGLFKFAELELIIVCEEKPLFLCSALNTIGYFSGVRGYEVEHTDNVINWFAIEQEKLLDPIPLPLYQMSSGEKIVVLKYTL
ncbi:uncharacterized protein LOC117653729 [Thrips palmi]|uniref:Uncharacterized protein LOC117653729 n=1 Tax=Thrips palmi TaxID=161013 RepID=A0A6P9ADQ0_THRPL|nr:uncharacterized protein LOC117653729 [Thrips palmi]